MRNLRSWLVSHAKKNFILHLKHQDRESESWARLTHPSYTFCSVYTVCIVICEKWMRDSQPQKALSRVQTTNAPRMQSLSKCRCICKTRTCWLSCSGTNIHTLCRFIFQKRNLSLQFQDVELRQKKKNECLSLLDL